MDHVFALLGGTLLEVLHLKYQRKLDSNPGSDP